MTDLLVRVPGRIRAPTTTPSAPLPDALVPRWSRGELALIAGFVLLAAGLGAADLGRPLAIDGAATRLFVTTPGVAGISEDGGNMALYYLLMHFVVRAFGTSVFVLRIPSLVFGAATVPIVAALGRRVANPRVGLLSAALFVVSLPLIAWDEAARGYTLGMLLASAGVLAWLSLMRKPGLMRAGVYVMFSSLATYTLLLNWWIVAGEFVVWVWAVRTGRRTTEVRDPAASRWSGGALAAVALWTALLAVIALRQGVSGFVVGRNKVTLPRIGHTVLVLASAANGGATTRWVVAGAVLALVTAGLWVTGMLSSWRALLRPVRLFEARLSVATLALWIVMPPLGQVAVSMLVHPMYQYRYFIPCLPAAAVLTAMGVDRARRAGVLPYVGCATVVLSAHVVFLTQLYG